MSESFRPWSCTQKSDCNFLILCFFSRSNIYASVTFNPNCAEEFLSWESVDIDNDYPRQGKTYIDAEGKKITRSEALSNKVQIVHQEYIDARKIGTREVPQGWTGHRFEQEQSAALAEGDPSMAVRAGPVGSNKPSRAPKPKATTLRNDSNDIVSQTRFKLQAIHRNAVEKISKAYEERTKDVSSDEGDGFTPTISTEVDRLVFAIVDCHTRLQLVRMRQKHATKTKEDIARIESELHKFRAELILQVQRDVNWEESQDPVLRSCQLFLEEFPARM